MSIDEIFSHLRTKTSNHEWISLEDFNSIMRRYSDDENTRVMLAKFLEKYFLEINEKSKQIRLNRWTKNLFS
jgi:hypothetical protein